MLLCIAVDQSLQKQIKRLLQLSILFHNKESQNVTKEKYK